MIVAGRSRIRRTGMVKPGTTEHLVLLAARASGRIEAGAIKERFGYYPIKAITDLCAAGFLIRDGHKDTVLHLTPAGRQSCPDRRAIPNRPYQP